MWSGRARDGSAYESKPGRGCLRGFWWSATKMMMMCSGVIYIRDRGWTSMFKTGSHVSVIYDFSWDRTSQGRAGGLYMPLRSFLFRLLLFSFTRTHAHMYAQGGAGCSLKQYFIWTDVFWAKGRLVWLWAWAWVLLFVCVAGGALVVAGAMMVTKNGDDVQWRSLSPLIYSKLTSYRTR